MNRALYFKLFPFHIFIKKTVLQRSSMRYVRINCSYTHKQLKLSGLLHFPPHICLFIATFDFLCLCRHYTPQVWTTEVISQNNTENNKSNLLYPIPHFWLICVEVMLIRQLFPRKKHIASLEASSASIRITN